MIDAIRRNTLQVVGLGSTGLLCALAVPAFVSHRGSAGPLLLEAVSPIRGVVMVLAVLVVSVMVAGAVGRLVNAAVGLFVLGGGFFILAARTETVRELAFAGGWGSVPFETAAWSVIVLGAAWAVYRLAGPLADIEPTEAGVTPSPWLSKESLISSACGAVVLPAVWLIAQSPSKGQAIAAVAVGSIGAGLVARLLSPHVQPILIVATPVLFGAIGQFIAVIMLNTPLDDALVSGTVPAWLIPMPLDYAAGAMLGVPVGIGWASSFLTHEDEKP